MDHELRYRTELDELDTAPGDRISTAELLRFLIVDDHALVRFGLSLALKQRYAGATVTEAGSLADALHKVRSARDLAAILYDLHLSDCDGMDGLMTMLEAAGDVPVIVVSGTGDSGTIAACIRAGVRAFIHKGCEAAVLDQALPIVLSGGIFVPAPPVAHGGNPIRIPLPSTAPPPRTTTVVDNLTDRQRQVLLLLLEGQSNKEIARRLGVLEGTIKVHLRTVMQRLGVRNRTQLALAAVKAGVVPTADAHHKHPSQ